MNKNLYRIVFNKARGMRMVVPETASSQTKGDAAATGGIVKSKHTWTFNLKAIPIAIGLGLGYLAILPAQGAGIVADGAAPANQRPIVLNAGNNVPLVNIQTPSAAGVSRNTYSQFDVGNQGAILNNSRTDVQTQLGGYVQANPYLATGAARVILNEVNSNNPSLLQGYVEVAGSRAQVVIANPSGITCDGFGFINTSRATLTTGTPNLIGGNLESYRVERGTVTAQGKGLDASTADYTDIIARAANVNAGIWTNTLKVTTGVNTVNADNSQATVIAGAAASPAPSFAVDVASLGGMYAGKIMMIGTQAGVGVRNAGNIGANVGELVLTQDGRLENTGRINSAGNTTVTTTRSINNTGTIYAQGNTSLNTQSDVSNTGLIAAYGNTQISALGANSRITSTSTGILAAGLKTDGTLNVTGDLSVTATNQVSAVGKHLAAGTLRFSGQTLTLTQSQTSAQTIILSASHGALDATGATLSANGELNASATTLLNTDGAKLAANQLNISAHDLSNVAGELIQVDTGDTTINLLGNLDNTQGRIASNSANLTLAADTLNNTQGKIEHAGAGLLKLSANRLLNTNTASIGTNADLVIEGGGIDNRGGRIDVQKNARFTLSQDLDNTASLVRVGQTLIMNAAQIINASTQGIYQGVANQGLMAQSVVINTATLNNNLGNISANDQLTLNSHGHLDNTQGLLSSAKAITLQDTLSSAKGLTITNTGGTIIAKDQVTIDSASMTGDGDVYSRGNLNVNLDADYNNTGILQATQHLSFSTKGKLTNQSNILAGVNLGLSAADVDNQASGQMIGSNTSILASNSLTNRGLIDGGDTFIDTVTLNNIGTGRIYGDHVAIQTDALNNKEETLGGQTKAAVIAARDRLDIGAKTITNQEHALLFSAGNMAIGGGLDGNHQATGIADTLNNKSATIESLNNLNLSARQINNTNEHFSTAIQPVSSENIAENQGSGSPTRYAVGTPGLYISRGCHEDVDCLYTPDGEKYEDYYLYSYNRDISETTVTNSDPAKILAANFISMTADNLLNDKSQIVAGGTLSGLIGHLDNTSVDGKRNIADNGTVRHYWRDVPKDSPDVSKSDLSSYNPATVVQSITLTPTVYKQNTVPSGTGTQVNTLSTSSVNKTVASATGANATASANRTTGPDINIPNNSLFKVNLNTGNHYLVETDPSFTNYKTWLSSDYMLKALAYDPAATQKRLGDGFYEQKLMRDQITQLTGHRFLDGYASDEAQYQALMNNAVNYAKSVNLRPGIALSANQAAQLTTDIIWLVEQTVTLPDGSTTQALVPQVYVALKSGDLLPSGALISGNNVALNVNDALNNQGTIAGRNIVNLSTANLNNIGGQIQGADLNLKALQDINNIGGSITASNSLTLQAGRDINVVSTTSTQTAASGSRTNVDRVAGLYVTSNLGNMVAIAGNNINLIAAQIIHDAPTAAGIPSAPNNSAPANANQGTTVLSAGKDINLGTVTTAQNSSIVWDSRNYLNESSSQEVGTQIQTQGDINLQAGNNLNAKATNITSQNGALNGVAGKNINITAGQKTQSQDAASYHESDDFLYSSSTSIRNTLNDSAAVSTGINADSIHLQAGIGNPATKQGDITAQSANIVATNNVDINAAGNVNITTAEQAHDETYFYEHKESGFLSGGGLGFTIGNRKLTTTNDGQQTTNAGSTIGSINGDVNITAGNTYNQTGSDVLAPQGDINIVASDVNIKAATNTNANQQTMKFKQTGLTVSISNPVISAVETGSQMAQAASQTKDPRMQALAAATAALSAKNAIDAVKSGQSLYTTQHGDLANAADQVGGITLSVSLGTSKSSSESQQNSTQAASSHVTAGRDLNIVATGDSSQATAKKDTGNINVIGSDLSAGRNATLVADNAINMQAAQDNSQQTSSNKSSSASIGASYNTATGFSVSASASKGKGNSNGSDTTYTNSHLSAGNITQTESGTDTTLAGASIQANQIIADVGTKGTGNFNIASLQDNSTYQAKQSSAGFSINVPVGGTGIGGSVSTSKSNTNSNYASVNEQSGLKAGDGGFQVNVNGNTDLKGAVIASTDKAIQDNRNRLTTQTLSTSNIENKADYDANSASVSIGGGTQTGKPVLTGAGVGSDDGRANSQTVSGVGAGKVNVTDIDKQTAITGSNSVATVAMLNRDVKVNQQGAVVDSQGNTTAHSITPIFNAEKVAKEIQTQVQITQAFGQQAGQAVTTYVQTQIAALKNQLANANTDSEKVQIKAQIDEVATQERVMNILVGAVTGMGGSAITKEGLSLAADQMRQLMIEDSKKFPGVTDGTTELTNTSGTSEGVRADNTKVGGTRIDLDKLCGPSNERCAKNSDGTLALNANNQVVWNAKDQNGNPISLASFLETDQGKEAAGATGGIQGWKGTLFGTPYVAGSWEDKLIESFSGTHDFVGGKLSGLYDEQGNATRGRSEELQKLQDAWSASGAIVVSTPFAMAEYLPSQVWQAISVLLKGAK